MTYHNILRIQSGPGHTGDASGPWAISLTLLLWMVFKGSPMLSALLRDNESMSDYKTDNWVRAYLNQLPKACIVVVNLNNFIYEVPQIIFIAMLHVLPLVFLILDKPDHPEQGC